MGWPTVTECKEYSANIPEIVNADSSVIEGKIEDAKIFIKRHCKQEFDKKETSISKYFNGNDSDTLDLYPRCYAITAVVSNSYSLTDLVNLKYGNNFSYLEAEYEIADLGARFGVRTKGFDRTFPLGSNNIKITGDWGWTDVPADIKNICKELVERLVIKRLDIRQLLTPFQSERTPDGYGYTKQVGGTSILDYELALKINEYVYDLISITKL